MNSQPVLSSTADVAFKAALRAGRTRYGSPSIALPPRERHQDPERRQIEKRCEKEQPRVWRRSISCKTDGHGELTRAEGERAQRVPESGQMNRGNRRQQADRHERR